jgi:hypothetical protein
MINMKMMMMMMTMMMMMMMMTMMMMTMMMTMTMMIPHLDTFPCIRQLINGVEKADTHRVRATPAARSWWRGGGGGGRERATG